VIDFGLLPPEVNSARMYAGPGLSSLSSAAAAWDSLATELRSVASSYRTVIKGLTSEGWLGPSSMNVASAFGPYVAWTAGVAARAEEAGGQAKLALEAFEAAFTMTVPPPAVAANRVQLASLLATNFIGQNSAAIAATEAEYSEMWAQDAAAMYTYAASSASATTMTTFTPPPDVTNPAGTTTQNAAVNHATAFSAAQQSSLTNIVSSVPSALNALASPTSTVSTGGLGGLSSALSDSGFSVGGLAESIIASYANLAGFAVVFTGLDALAPLMNPDVFLPFMNMGAAAAAPAAAAAAAPAALGSGFAGGLGGFAGLGQAASVGGLGLSVPPSWGSAAAGPMAAMLGGVPLAGPLTGAALGLPGGLPVATGLPVMMGGLPRAAAAGVVGGAIGGAVAANYSPRLKAVARTPAGGYPADPDQHPMAYPVPGHGFPPPAPGYVPAIVYLPANGHAPAEV
jgi:PPE-repeat protein